jgi:hypothetical protein
METSTGRLKFLANVITAEWAGAVVREVEPPTNPELIPFGFGASLLAGRWAHDHIQWMRQKDALEQDMFLLGMHGPLRRWLALLFCETSGREMEYLALTADTTESDLKQRREILASGSSVYFDQSAVNAALYGRVLVVEGLEKVERNVMPVLNNLLENREIALEDGRFLLPRARYEELSEEQRAASRLVPVHPNFRVIALGVPVPPFPGNPLDPPLRSRFQGRQIDPAPSRALLTAIRRCGPQQAWASLRGLCVCGAPVFCRGERDRLSPAVRPAESGRPTWSRRSRTRWWRRGRRSSRSGSRRRTGARTGAYPWAS